MNPDPTSLDRLHDVVAAPPVPWWPLAPGWYFLGALVLVVSFYAAILGFIRWQQNRYRREALSELQKTDPLFSDARQRAAALASLAALLKRTALSAWPREQVATLTGPGWFSFLDDAAGTKDFSSGAGATLETAAYDPAKVESIDELRCRELSQTVRNWLMHHRRPASKC